jgi:SnoaL-like domain
MPFTGPLEDRVAIRELMDTHAHGVMTKDAEIWGSIWADDASWSLPDYPDLGAFEGKETIVSGWIESMKVYARSRSMATPQKPLPIPLKFTTSPAPANVSTEPVAMTTYSKSAMANGCSPGVNIRSCWRSEQR